jgi:hypothetical protein
VQNLKYQYLLKQQAVLEALEQQVLPLQALRQRSVLEALTEPPLHHLRPFAPSQRSLKEVQMYYLLPHQLLVLRSWVVAVWHTSDLLQLLLWTP